MVKFVGIVLCIVLAFFTTVRGDTITLRKDGKDIDLKVTGFTGEYVKAILLKKDIKSLKVQFLNTNDYPDLIILNRVNVSVVCKIKDTTEEAIHVLIPTSTISSLLMSFHSEDKQASLVSGAVEGEQRAGDVVVEGVKTGHMGERGPAPKFADDMREKGKADELRISSDEKVLKGKNYRLRTKKMKEDGLGVEGELSKIETEGVTEDANESSVNEQRGVVATEASGLKQKMSNELPDNEGVKAGEEGMKKEKPVVQDPNLGRVEGRILHSGKPLPDCQVKLQMLEKGGFLAKGYHPVEGALEIETQTDKDGAYCFMNISSGQYKLYWKPPSETAWVRRFKMEPDVIVNSGKLTKPKDIETLKRTLN